MIVLVSGGCKNGKSSFAQQLACSLSASGRRYYLATMLPSDDEDDARILRHIQDRAGLHFETVEQGTQILRCLEQLDPSGTVLLDSLTALLANEMFAAAVPDTGAAARVIKELELFARYFEHGNVVFVSDSIASDALSYEMLTEQYRASLAACERGLAALSDIVVEMCAGKAVVHKGRTLWPSLPEAEKEECRVELIIGGACQGKLSYAKRHFDLKEEDIFVCTRDAEADFSKRCIAHLENYVYFCLKAGKEPQDSFAPQSILICDDIFCGVVPLDAFERAWREKTGRYLQKLARSARLSRIFCGLAYTF